jgi:hypothetical protein
VDGRHHRGVLAIAFAIRGGNLVRREYGHCWQPPSRHLVRTWWRRAEKLAEIPRTARLGWYSLRRKFVNDLKADIPMADLCYLGGWKSPLTVMTVYQQTDRLTMKNALSKREQRRAVRAR